MLKFGVDNLRRLKSVDPIELKPITLLVGRNSSGKSTYLRSLPLIKQSLLTRTSSPILWYGDYVDFGSFESSSSGRSKADPITFKFEIDELDVDNSPSSFISPSRVFTDKYENIRLVIRIVPFRERTRISEMELILGGYADTKYTIRINENDDVYSIEVNGREAIGDIEPYRMIVRSNSVFPEILVLDKQGSASPFASILNPRDYINFYKSLDGVLRVHMDGRLKKEKIDELLINMIAAGFPNSTYLRTFGKSGPKVLTKFLNDLTGADFRGIYPAMETILAVSALIPLMRTLALKLRSILSSTLYIGPARARSERYYRYQDLAVTEIDPDGKNFPVFLNSLTARQLQSLSGWVKSLFNYGLAVNRERDHVSINIIESGSQPNIVDVGYGISQILPVLGQIWWAKNRPRRKAMKSSLTMLVIEQPELHLHPAHQALLADAFVNMASSSDESKNEETRVHYVVETHSETLINRLGELIADGKIESSAVQIVIFERNAIDEQATDTRVVSYDTDGTLVDWPYGFFQPSI